MNAAAPAVTLELTLAPGAAAKIRRAVPFERARPLLAIWHDDPEGSLARQGLGLCAWREGRETVWRVEAVAPGGTQATPPGAMARCVAEAPTLVDLAGVGLPERLASRVRLAGRVRTAVQGGVVLRMLEAQSETGLAVTRLMLAGPWQEVGALALALPGTAVARRGLGASVLAEAGLPVPAVPLGAPAILAGPPPGAVFAAAAGHLLGVLLHHAPAASEGQRGEPVHQMRVALRRLRALAVVFGPAVACPALEAVRPGLKALARALGPARDWDVFLSGVGPAVAAAFADEPSVGVLLAEAEAQREAAYRALAQTLAGPVLRTLAVSVTVLVQARPWGDADGDTKAFGAALLSRRLRRLARRAAGIVEMPVAELHALRLYAKRLRYAAEVFAPLYPGRGTRRWLNRLAALQEVLGRLNDGVVAASLMHSLAGAGGSGLAGGLVRGYVAGGRADARKEIARAWRRLRKIGPFWT